MQIKPQKKTTRGPPGPGPVQNDENDGSVGGGRPTKWSPYPWAGLLRAAVAAHPTAVQSGAPEAPDRPLETGTPAIIQCTPIFRRLSRYIIPKPICRVATGSRARLSAFRGASMRFAAEGRDVKGARRWFCCRWCRRDEFRQMENRERLREEARVKQVGGGFGGWVRLCLKFKSKSLRIVTGYFPLELDRYALLLLVNVVFS